jgi:hypothetical protein
MYVQGLKKIPNNFTLIQVDLKNIHADIIHEKQPILIYDKIVDPKELMNTVFKYFFISIKKVENLKKNVFDNKNTYAIIHAKSENVDVEIKHPKFQDIMRVKMAKHNVLMVPCKWKIDIKSKNFFEIYFANSFITKLFCLY